MLVNKLFDKGIYAVGTLRRNKKQIAQIKIDKKMKRSIVGFKYSVNVLCCKWFDDKSVLILASNIEVMDTCTTVSGSMKSSSWETSITCSSLGKFYKKSMWGDNITD